MGVLYPFYEFFQKDSQNTTKPNMPGAERSITTVISKTMPKIGVDKLSYSDKYDDGTYEYRHIHCPKEYGKKLKEIGLMSEEVWRYVGIQQSVGWQHYMIHEPSLTCCSSEGISDGSVCIPVAEIN